MEKLLELLEQRGLETDEEIALECGISVAELRSQVEKWKVSGVIVGQPILINNDKINDPGVKAYIEVKITPERGGGFDRLANRISRFDQVISCALFSGGYDLMVVVKGKNLMEVAAFVSEKLSTIDGVLSTQSHFKLKTYKESGIQYQQEEEEDRLPVTP